MELDDAIAAPRSIIAAVLRALWWLAWDFGVETIGWSIGWGVCRLVTAGRFPHERLASRTKPAAASPGWWKAPGCWCWRWRSGW